MGLQMHRRWRARLCLLVIQLGNIAPAWQKHQNSAFVLMKADVMDQVRQQLKVDRGFEHRRLAAERGRRLA